ncbi:hypothetical protein WDU94_008174 [Cyamophila willieti]
MNTFCFTQSTFTYINESRMPLTYPGIRSSSNEDPVRYHSYYQWVPILLFIQAMTLMTPHYLWKDKEGGLMGKMLKTNDHYLLKTSTGRRAQFRKVSSYIIKRQGSWDGYAYCYLVNILFNTGAVFLNIYSTEILLGGYFKYLGKEFVNYLWTSVENRVKSTNPLDISFPKMTKCTFHKYGPSGTIESVDAMCILPLNNFNEKIFIFLWFWYLLLFCISITYSFVKINQGIAIVSKNMFLIRRYLAIQGVKDEDLKVVISRLDTSQWFVVDIIRINLSPLYYKDFIGSLVEKVTHRKLENNHSNNNNTIVIVADTGNMANGQIGNDHRGNTDPHS